MAHRWQVPLIMIMMGLLSTAVMAAGLSLSVDKYVQIEPGTVVYTIRLPLERDDVYLCWGFVRYFRFRYRDGTLEDRDEGRRSCMVLSGEHDQPFHRPMFSRLPWGEYVGFVEVYGKGNKLDSPRLITTRGFRILSTGPEE